MEPQLEIDAWADETAAKLKRIRDAAREATAAVKEAIELREKARELGIEFLQLDRKDKAHGTVRNKKRPTTNT